ncbi:MAG: GGDEF domain-containing protein, partial [Treponema sp.]|nr:GGDEF domain-containing protein [Treponema sp.]
EHYYEKLSKSDKSINTSVFYTLKNFFDSNKDLYKTGDTVFFETLIEKLGYKAFKQDFLALKPNIVIPLIGIDGVYGITVMGNKLVSGDYTASELTYLHHMFSMFAITMQNELHYRSVITDVKTGLFTYDYFVKRVQEKIAAVQRHSASAAILMLDIDHFKKINDTFGHLIGDKVIIAIAQTLLRITREDDCVARFGGEEFSVLLSECLPDTLFAVAERIRIAVENMKLYEDGDFIPVTASIGACYIDPQEGMTADRIMKRVDRALYLSKERGRNKTTIFSLGLLEKACLQAQTGVH